MITATAAVHTTGVNWDSLLVIIAAIVSAVAAVAGLIVRRMDRNRERSEAFFAQQISHVSELFAAQIAAISSAIGGRLDRVEGHLRDQDKETVRLIETTSRLQGHVEARSMSEAERKRS